MIQRLRKLLGRTRTRTRLGFALVFAAAVAAAVYLLPGSLGVPLLAAALVFEAALGVLLLVQVFNRLGQVRSLRRDGPAVVPAPRMTPSESRTLANWKARLWNGFSATALPLMRGTVSSVRTPVAYRIATAEILLDFYDREAQWRASGVDHEFDVVIASFFGLPGGTTSANAEEIRAYRNAGLRVGLLNYPVFRWNVSRTIDDKITDLVDGDRVVLIGYHDRVRCDLLIVRFPGVGMQLLDDAPSIEAAEKVLVVNQTPYSYYGEFGGVEVIWDVRTVRTNLTAWLGEHTWYSIGPVVGDALREHHAEETGDVVFAEDFWFESIDIAEWRREGRRPGDGPIRIGRHSRDSRLKWPNDPLTLKRCYPEGEEFEIRVLGGVDAAREILGGLPANWVDQPFNSVESRDFLHGLDVMVYFISADGAEAFGRAPLEAMAVGLPCVMDRRFEPLFGPAAVYCEPEEVAVVVKGLVEDPEAYAEQSRRALEFVSEHFSHEALLRRVRGLGVRAASEAASV
ncbi:glycosyltransferase [Glycomyces paridis]|uniref:Glycosyltransferase family 4 protein n=1 Tax=Glycomyces paridis TaxID=2126555 RepID=A0A4S8PE04_9ACTN|nr:glycosyltransferase family 4 protein [Glycomyces paridis]THV28031.1 glycosyltransferase family 4 protein [Glycomyces paridis]